MFATLATLFFVPVVFAIAHGRKAHASQPDAPHDPSLGEAYVR